MAKRRDEAGPDEGAEAAGLAELEALREKVALLEAQLAGERASRTVDVVGDLPADGASYWQVTLKYAPTHVVRASDPANAWEQYRQEMGVITSEFRPEVSPATREDYRLAQARRLGVRPEEFRLDD